jgi:hypothetical protein
MCVNRTAVHDRMFVSLLGYECHCPVTQGRPIIAVPLKPQPGRRATIRKIDDGGGLAYDTVGMGEHERVDSVQTPMTTRARSLRPVGGLARRPSKAGPAAPGVAGLQLHHGEPRPDRPNRHFAKRRVGTRQFLLSGMRPMELCHRPGGSCTSEGPSTPHGPALRV